MMLIQSKKFLVILLATLCWDWTAAADIRQQFIDGMSRAANTEIDHGQIEDFIRAIGSYDRSDIYKTEMMLKFEFNRYSEKDKKWITHAFLKATNEIVSQKGFVVKQDLEELEITYNNFLRALFLLFPERQLKELFFNEPETHRSILSQKGVEAILHHLCPTPLDPLPIHKTRFVAFDQLSSIFSELDQKSKEGEVADQYLVMRHTVKGQEPHLTPIFVHLADDGAWDIITLDTLGLPWDLHDYKTEYLKHNWHFVELIANQVNPSNTLSRPVRIFAQKTRRQNDMYSCGVMTLYDVMDYSHIDFRAFLRQMKSTGRVHTLQPEETIVNLPYVQLNSFDFLPVPFMRTIQSNKVLKGYTEQSDKIDFMDMKEVGELNEHIQKYMVSTSDGFEFNYFARSEFYRLTEWLLRSALELP
jgi:hypothetical protein